jgi:hypothetical protein
MNENECAVPMQPQTQCDAPAGAYGLKVKQRREFSYLDSPEGGVVLSHRLRSLIHQVGGCQVEQVEAVIKRLMFEILSNQKGGF